MSKLDKAKNSLELSKERLKKISDQSQTMILDCTEEDKHSNTLRNWCLNVRSGILVPSTEAQSETSRPPVSGTLAPAMKRVIAEAEHLGIHDLSDVKKMADCFRSICWSFSAMVVLRHKPSLSEVSHLILEASKFKLPDEKALKTMKFMANRASQLQSKVAKALYPKKSEPKSINVASLKELESRIRELPLVVREEETIRVVIEDNGTRHCICGRPRDGDKMYYCNCCSKRFHGACIEADKAGPKEQSQHLCPCCKGDGNSSHHKLVLETEMKNLKWPTHPFKDFNDDASPHAPNPVDLWPPFGSIQSQAAIEAFGSECLAIAETTTVSSNATAHESGFLTACFSSSQALTEKGVVASSEGHERIESKVPVEIKECSPESKQINGHSQHDEEYSSSAPSKKDPGEMESAFDQIQPVDLKIQRPPPNPPVLEPSLQNDKKILISKISHERGQPTTDSKICDDISGSKFDIQEDSQWKHEAQKPSKTKDVTETLTLS
jgi:hypothetical protein